MLRKLLKYDLQAVFRFWWMAVAVSVAISIVGGYAFRLENEDHLPNIIASCAALVRFVSLFSAAALLIVSMVLIFIRFYKHFFSDEGYLTFTLPVKRQTLLNSKVIAGFLSMLASTGVCFLDLLIMAIISTYSPITPAQMQANAEEFITEVQSADLGLLPLHILEFAVMGLLLLLMSVLFLYCCISFGSMIVKKGKLIASIGIYYGANSIFSSVAMLFLIFGISSIMFWLDAAQTPAQDSLLALIYLGIIFFLAMLCGLMYAFQYWMLGKKLNLS